MKRTLVFFLPFIVMFGSGCLKKTDESAANASINVPSGTFAGQFLKIHYSFATKKYDTLKCNLTLAIDLKTGYKITGDTATVHAGSYGDFSMDPYYVQFVDKTLPATVTTVPKKSHLVGTYLYGYDGTNFQIQAIVNDTIGLFYNFKRQ